MKKSWTENNRTLTVSFYLDHPNPVNLSILAEGVAHPGDPSAGAAVESLLEKDGKYGAKLWSPIGKIAVVTITKAQYESAKSWIAQCIADAKTAADSTPTVDLKWSGSHSIGFKGSFVLAQKALKKLGIQWVTDSDATFPNSVTLTRAQYNQFLALMETLADRTAITVETHTQLWQPCSSCGEEPCFSTSHGFFCVDCQKMFIGRNASNN